MHNTQKHSTTTDEALFDMTHGGIESTDTVILELKYTTQMTVANRAHHSLFTISFRPTLKLSILLHTLVLTFCYSLKLCLLNTESPCLILHRERLNNSWSFPKLLLSLYVKSAMFLIRQSSASLYIVCKLVNRLFWFDNNFEINSKYGG